MRIEMFDYVLPPYMIAQRPLPRREESRLMILDRRGGTAEAGQFTDLPKHLRRGDLLVINDTRVLPARLRARKPTGGKVEILLVRREGNGSSWWCMTSPGRGLVPGTRLAIGDELEAEMVERDGNGRFLLTLHARSGSVDEAIHRHGVPPVPPYVRREPGDDLERMDRERYQTVYAREEGAIAAPTAGLHFTEEAITGLQGMGIGLARVTLHVGPGAFQPVRTTSIEDHRVEAEWARLPEATAAAIADCRRRGGRVVAVGTTTTRLLESRAEEDGRVRPGEGWCELTIGPEYRFRAVDALVTNFHLPRSSLLVLVAAFAGRTRILAAYTQAVEQRFRFYSYGDAMLIL